MVFQGDANDIDPRSSTGQFVNKLDQEKLLPRANDNTGLAARVMQELRVGEHRELATQKHEPTGHLQPDKSSSRLTEMLGSVSPHMNKLNGDFQPNCPSAVPSPLHKIPGSFVQPQPFPGSPASFNPWGQPHIPKSIEDHFFMTNEHLDVVGKTTWDLLEISKQQHSTALHSRHEQLLALFEKHVEAIKSQIDTVNEKADRTADKHNNIHNDIDKILSVIKQDVVGALTTQDKKVAEMEINMKELQKTVQALQQSLEQGLSEPKSADQQLSATGAFPTPNSALSNITLPANRSQPSLAGYYGNTTGLDRENQAPVSSPHDKRGIAPAPDSHSEHRGGYGGGYGQQWSIRPGYSGRNGKEDRPAYSGTNPYHFANGGQFSNGYVGGYPPYGFSTSPPDQHYTYNQGSTK